MNKRIILLSIATAAAIGFTGCFGGGASLNVPNVKKDAEARTQEIDAKLIDKVNSKGADDYMMVLANKRLKTPFECKVAYNVIKKEILSSTKLALVDELKFAEKISSALTATALDCTKEDRKVTQFTMAEMAKDKKELHDTLASAIVEVQKIFASRKGFIADNKALANLNVQNIQIAMISDFDSMTARYFPVGKIVLAGIDEEKLKTDKAYKSQFAFLIAHELVHAYALHTTEEMTEKSKFDVVLEVALNEAYKRLDKNIQSTVNNGANLLAKGLLTKADYDFDNKVTKERSSSMVAMALKGKADKLELIGVGLTIPQTTKLVLMERISSQLGKPMGVAITDAIALFSTDTKDIETELGAHPHSQEFEADALGLKAVKAMGLDVNAAISIFDDIVVKEALENKKATSSHPLASARIIKLNQTGLASK